MLEVENHRKFAWFLSKLPLGCPHLRFELLLLWSNFHEFSLFLIKFSWQIQWKWWKLPNENDEKIRKKCLEISGILQNKNWSFYFIPQMIGIIPYFALRSGTGMQKIVSALPVHCQNLEYEFSACTFISGDIFFADQIIRPFQKVLDAGKWSIFIRFWWVKKPFLTNFLW